ncbi:hypothetical protein ACIQNU_25085 [Streptomyces sp. NPDC091292]|uniref:hypothetical protein n=1 Tax=Streptomyces sp. NPDC091292 TaxID=3365991 RepID=UPI0038113E4F
MEPELLLLALGTGLGSGFLLLAVRQTATIALLSVRGVLVKGRVTERAETDRRRGGLVVFTDHLGRSFVLDPGASGPWRGLPPIGAAVPVVYPRNRPHAARVWLPRHLLAPPFGWFLAATVAFGTALTVAR